MNRTKEMAEAVRQRIERRIADFRVAHLSRFSAKSLKVLSTGALCVVLLSVLGFVSAVEDPEKGFFRPNEELVVLEEMQVALSEADALSEAELEKVAEEPAVGIYINGEEVLAVATEADAETVINAVLAHYQTASSNSEIVDVSYTEEVDVRHSGRSVIRTAFSVEEAVNYIITGNKEPKTYTVVSGDTMWDIAAKNNVSVFELIESNPATDADTLKIGQVLNLYECKPYLHVRIKEKVTATESIAYGISYEETSTLWKGEVQVKSAGANGSKEVVYEVISENGVKISQNVISTTVITEPVTQIALKGTKPLSYLVGTGSFCNPMSNLQVSSSFGSRGGGRHYGVDLRNPKGTAIYVVDDGVVNYAGYSGSFGNIVKVSHGNGVETWYAHCDTMLVSIGDVLSKGQQIATVGRTGRATGYHLHFEVRLNGVAQNPMNYL